MIDIGIKYKTKSITVSNFIPYNPSLSFKIIIPAIIAPTIKIAYQYISIPNIENAILFIVSFKFNKGK